MNQQDRLDLKKLMAQNSDYEDNTEGIRRLKHSDLIVSDVKKIETYKTTMKSLRMKNKDEFRDYCISKCSFLFNQYTDIFNRLLRDELDLQLLYQLLETLKKIENGQIDQQEGSVVVGKILHKIFVESAMKHSDNVNMSLADKGELEDNEPKIQGKDISWSKYKREMLKAKSV